jgi:hypothetical protein
VEIDPLMKGTAERTKGTGQLNGQRKTSTLTSTYHLNHNNSSINHGNSKSVIMGTIYPIREKNLLTMGFGLLPTYIGIHSLIKETFTRTTRTNLLATRTFLCTVQRNRPLTTGAARFLNRLPKYETSWTITTGVHCNYRNISTN